MDILMRASEEIAGKLYDWNVDSERPFWRGKKPTQAIDRVYFVRDGFIIGWAKFSGYEYVETQTVQGRVQSGDAFIVKGPFKHLNTRVSSKFLRGQWRWRYVTDDMMKDLKLG